MSPFLHPLIDNGLTKGSENFSGGNLHCRNVLYNHACGCSKCWKPEGALFSVVAVVPIHNVTVTANKEKLAIVDQSATIQRYACKQCGVHLFGRIEEEHVFKGLDFIHVKLSDENGWQEP
jgi:S-(hydroxymethyl)glutathione synthase